MHWVRRRPAAWRACWSTRAMPSRSGNYLPNSIRLTSTIASRAADSSHNVPQALSARRKLSWSRRRAVRELRSPVRVVPPNYAHAVSSAKRLLTPSSKKPMPRRRQWTPRPPKWRRRGAITNARWPMLPVSASCARRHCWRVPSMASSVRDCSNRDRRSLPGRPCCRSLTRRACGSGRASTRARPAACASDSQPRSCCARMPSVPTRAKSSASIG